MSGPKARSNAILKVQPPMRRVLLALTPLTIAAVYLFGWRMLWLLAVANAAAFLAEYAFVRSWKQPVTSAVFVTATLFVFSLPPPIPLWMAVVGVVFAVVFGKMVFGGFGRNVFNPALSGRAFIYISFGAYMTARWNEPFTGFPGGFGQYAVDAVTSATPGMLLKEGAQIPFLRLLLGNTSGTIGGTSALLAAAGGLYLLKTRTANYRIVVSGIGGYLVVQTLLWAAGVQGAVDPLRGMLAGSFMVGICFYATDPVSASQTALGRWFYGAAIGMLSSLITVFSIWPAGTMFAILLANMFAPIMDYAIRRGAEGGRAS